MLSLSQLRQAAGQAKRDIHHIEIDVLLTFLLQMFSENGLMNDLAFKGGTMLRKMVFGPQGRLSTDLDFTLRSDRDFDDIMFDLLELLDEEYRGITFRLERDKDCYITDDSGSVNPVCSHEANPRGVKIKIQISRRERPILSVSEIAQIDQVYFRNLDFQPLDIPCLAFEEVVSEKIRAASQRAKIRDLYDLSEISQLTFNESCVRSLAVLKLWQTQGPGLDYVRLLDQVNDHDAYEVHDLDNLISAVNWAASESCRP